MGILCLCLVLLACFCKSSSFVLNNYRLRDLSNSQYTTKKITNENNFLLKAHGFDQSTFPILILTETLDVAENSMRNKLPPAWLPICLAIALFIGISIQQLSLGDVMDDEAKLGMMSGARAAKKSARNRNMFKNKK
mmetsp:Transcript_10049/g.15120  ORF Transcript_10049/g.15120 Transcript_10049/m.15120 type:complete len:136 (+) Transcript_10049:64-471(+)